MIIMSTGVLDSGFQILNLIDSHPPMTFANIKTNFRGFSSVSMDLTIEIIQELNWARADTNGIVSLTPAGRNIFDTPRYEIKLRAALLDYVALHRPPWLKLATYGRLKVIHNAIPDIRQIFHEACLDKNTTEDIVKFWSDLSATARGYIDDRNAEIGYEGERLTLKHEKMRTNRDPQWRSIENNEDGYDVLSFVGTADHRRLKIEVKTSNIGKSGTMHITRHEWQTALDTALDNRNEHVFHIWDLQSKELATVTSQHLANHIPCEQGKGEWESVKIPFSVFNGSFVKVFQDETPLTSSVQET